MSRGLVRYLLLRGRQLGVLGCSALDDLLTPESSGLAIKDVPGQPRPVAAGGLRHTAVGGRRRGRGHDRQRRRCSEAKGSLESDRRRPPATRSGKRRHVGSHSLVEVIVGGVAPHPHRPLLPPRLPSPSPPIAVSVALTLAVRHTTPAPSPRLHRLHADPDPAACGPVATAPSGCGLTVETLVTLPASECLRITRVEATPACPAGFNTNRAMRFDLTASTTLPDCAGARALRAPTYWCRRRAPWRARRHERPGHRRRTGPGPGRRGHERGNGCRRFSLRNY